MQLLVNCISSVRHEPFLANIGEVYLSVLMQAIFKVLFPDFMQLGSVLKCHVAVVHSNVKFTEKWSWCDSDMKLSHDHFIFTLNAQGTGSERHYALKTHKQTANSTENCSTPTCGTGSEGTETPPWCGPKFLGRSVSVTGASPKLQPPLPLQLPPLTQRIPGVPVEVPENTRNIY